MNLEELKKLIAQGETEYLEFKKTTGQRNEAAKTVCAMLNGLGGYVFIGITDKGEVRGQYVTSKTLEDIAIELHRISPPAFPEMKVMSLDENKGVIILHVNGERGTYTYDGRPYLRYGSTTQLMPRGEYEQRLLERLHATKRWENKLVPEGITIEDLDEEEIHLTLQNAVDIGRMEKPKNVDTQSILSGLGLTYENKLLQAAVALYGKSKKLFSLYPQCSIRLARFRGESRLADFTDNRQYWGHSFDLLRRAETFFLDHMPIAGRVVPGKMRREDYPMYPPRGMREALANAICHRDYTNHSGAVGLAMYNDHLEIINPGSFHFGMTPEKLIKPHQSKPWNPLIAEVFYRAGIIEKWGTGTLNIMEWCKENQNPTPRWEEQDESVVVTFFPSTAFEKVKLSKSQLESQLESKESRLSLEERVLGLLKNKGLLSKSEIAKELGQKMISGQLNLVLKNLLNKGIISYTVPHKPTSRLQRYKII